jgi:hypothetical protein
MALHQNLRGQCVIAVDATGVGEPVLDMLRSGRLGCEVNAVNITGGERETRSGSVWNVPKRDLMAGVQVLLEKGELKIARRMKETGSLVRELTDVRLTTGHGGRLRMGADRSGQHDDLVMALALALEGEAGADRVRDAEVAGDLDRTENKLTNGTLHEPPARPSPDRRGAPRSRSSIRSIPARWR